MSEEPRDVDPADAPAPTTEQAGSETTETKEQQGATGTELEAGEQAPEDSASDAETTGDDDGSAESSAEDGDETTGEDGQKKKRPSRYQRLRRQLNTAFEELETYRRREAETQAQTAQRQQQEQSRQQDPEPKEQDFNGDWNAYQEARIAWRVRQEVRGAFHETTQQQQQTQSERRQAELRREMALAHAEREDEARDRIPDYDKTVRAAQVEVSDTVGNLILDSDKSALLTYHLAKNTDALRELNRMTPIEAAKRIGQLEARLSLPRTNKTTKAPPPFTPPRGGGTPPPADIRKLAESDDITAYAKARETKRTGAKA